MAKLLQAQGLHWHHIGPWSLEVASGQCLGIAGPSGVGKSVLLRMLADLVPHEGQTRLDGVESTDMAAPAWRSAVRYCAATSGWWASRVAEHFTDLRLARERAKGIGLGDQVFEQSPDRLSTGERQRLALLRSLENEPSFLLLDEPTSALDAASTAAVEALLREQMAKGMGMVLVSHDLGQLERLATSVLDMSR